MEPVGVKGAPDATGVHMSLAGVVGNRAGPMPTKTVASVTKDAAPMARATLAPVTCEAAPMATAIAPVASYAAPVAKAPTAPW